MATRASGLRAAAFGRGARGLGASSTAVGDTAFAVGGRATAIGQRANAVGGRATAVGYDAEAGNNATAIGDTALASANGATAVGFHATAPEANSTAVGANATTTAANQVTLGGTGSSVRIGDIDASTAAQDGPVDVVTIDANGTLGKQQAASAASVANVRVAMDHIAAVSDAQFAALSNRVNSVFDLAETNRQGVNKASEGVAMALAMDSPALPSGTSFALSGGIGNYEGRTSLAMAVSAAVSETASVSAGIGVGATSGSVGTRAGFQVAW